MTDSVNLENLREMTGGDKDLEKELFDVFITSSDDCLNSLKANLDAGNEETWRTQAHAWKGMSLNLGAGTLGTLCAEAQMNHIAPQDEKEKLLAAIEAEYEKVKTYLKNV
ncbi:MAG: Hpt domain-containing protein [Bdellovibrionales bacterium]|jgi:HPt (histidine-containing phosphotransfer) domain-containing protein